MPRQSQSSCAQSSGGANAGLESAGAVGSMITDNGKLPKAFTSKTQDSREEIKRIKARVAALQVTCAGSCPCLTLCCGCYPP